MRKVCKPEQNALFDTIFIEKFEINDWVVVLPEDSFYYNSEQNCAQQIIDIIENYNSCFCYTLNFKNKDNKTYSKIRKATEEEIKIAKLPQIDYDKLQIGSVVKIKSTELICYDGGVDENSEYTIIYHNVPYLIQNNEFKSGSGMKYYTTLLKGGVFTVFGCDDISEINYITGVIKY